MHRFIGPSERDLVKNQAADFRRFGERYRAIWTPATLLLDTEGVEHHRVEGFLEADEFLAQLQLGFGEDGVPAEELERRRTALPGGQRVFP
jgi:hypothetical protein